MKKAGCLFIAMMAASQTVYPISRKDVLECGLPDGSSFVLTAKYDWSPLAKVIPADVANRLNQQPFIAQFRPLGVKTSIPISGSYSHKNIEDIQNSLELCSLFGAANGIPYVGKTVLMLANTRSFYEVKSDSKLHLFYARRENPERIRLEMDRLNAYPSYGVITLIGNRLVQEQSLINKDRSIVSVFKSESLDMGETWSDPIITTKSEIYVINIPVAEQCFIARPIRINGKKIDSKFPSCENKLN